MKIAGHAAAHAGHAAAQHPVGAGPGSGRRKKITAIPALVERLDLEGALVSIDAMGCNPNIAQSILDAKADYLLAVKDNQPTLNGAIQRGRAGRDRRQGARPD
jgi:hypothetical protein